MHSNHSHVRSSKGGTNMKLALILGVVLVFIVSFFTSGYEAKPGIPKDNQ